MTNNEEMFYIHMEYTACMKIICENFVDQVSKNKGIWLVF